jgi:O-antigen/teichoic acid export membrane protein
MRAANGLLLALLIPMFGAEGAAVASSVCFTLAGLAMICLAPQGAQHRWRTLGTGLAAGLAGWLVAATLAARDLIVLDAVAGALVAALILAAGGVLTRDIMARFLGGLHPATPKGQGS